MIISFLWFSKEVKASVTIASKDFYRVYRQLKGGDPVPINLCELSFDVFCYHHFNLSLLIDPAFIFEIRDDTKRNVYKYKFIESLFAFTPAVCRRIFVNVRRTCLFSFSLKIFSFVVALFTIEEKRFKNFAPPELKEGKDRGFQCFFGYEGTYKQFLIVSLMGAKPCLFDKFLAFLCSLSSCFSFSFDFKSFSRLHFEYKINGGTLFLGSVLLTKYCYEKIAGCGRDIFFLSRIRDCLMQMFFSSFFLQ